MSAPLLHQCSSPFPVRGGWRRSPPCMPTAPRALRPGIVAVICCLRRPFRRRTSSSVVYTPTSLEEGRGEVVGRASMPLSWFCRRSRSCLCPHPVARLGGPSWGISRSWWVSTRRLCFVIAPVPASTFSSICQRGWARFEVRWGARDRGGCPAAAPSPFSQSL